MVHRVSDVSFSDDAGEPASVAPRAVAPAEPIGALVSRQYFLSGSIVLRGILNRIREAFSAAISQTVLTINFMGAFGFSFDKWFAIIQSTERGILVGFFEYLWRGWGGWVVGGGPVLAWLAEILRMGI